jgi:ABC-2 type transport system permease protein
LRRARVVFWKEVKDLSRDYKTLAYVVLLPLVALPGMALLSGGLYTAQTVTVGIIDMDGSEASKRFVEGLAGYLRGAGLGANVVVVVGEPGDFTVVVREGFGDAVSSIDGTGFIEVSYVPGSPLAEVLESAVRSYVASFERRLVEARVQALSGLAGVEVDVEGLLDPVEVYVGFRAPTGEPVGGEARVAAFSARIIAFSLFFVVNPAIVFMSDAVVGERERRSLERLLSSPAKPSEILAGKMAASMLLSLAAAVADSVAIVVFFVLSGTRVEVGALMAAAWAVSTMLLVALTSALVAAVSAWSGSTRSAQSASFTIMMVALAVYFSSLVVDISSLPPWARAALLAIPFTHASLAIYSASFGDLGGLAAHLAAMAVFAALFAAAAVKVFKPERLVAFR